jgi:hypothetical protein
MAMSERVVEIGDERMYIRRDSERSVTIGPGLVIDPFNVRTWPPEMQASHRLRRALHELMPDPRYTLEVGDKPDGSPGIRIRSEFGVPAEAADFLKRYREQLITYLTWLELVDEYEAVDREVGLNERLLVGPAPDLAEAA